MTERWREAVEMHRETLEEVAAADLPISADVQELLELADATAGGEAT